MATGKDLRRLALSLEGTSEAPHFDRAAFKVVRIYVTLAADGRTANFKFTPDEQEFKCMLAPEAFSPVPNAWGKQGWTTATLSKLSAAELRRRSKPHGRTLCPRNQSVDQPDEQLVRSFPRKWESRAACSDSRFVAPGSPPSRGRAGASAFRLASAIVRANPSTNSTNFRHGCGLLIHQCSIRGVVGFPKAHECFGWNNCIM